MILTGFLSALVKGITGTGLGTVVVSLSTLALDAKDAVVLSSILSLFAGLIMYKSDDISLSRAYTLPVVFSVLAGTAIGAGMLKVLDKRLFEILLGTVFILMSLWFVTGGLKPRGDGKPPERADGRDIAVSMGAGACTGLVGISLPLLFWHFGSRLSRAYLRRMVVIIFIPGAFIQVLSYTAAGLLDLRLFVYSLAALPFVPLGTWLGGKLFGRMSEGLFRLFVGVFLVFAAFRLII